MSSAHQYNSAKKVFEKTYYDETTREYFENQLRSENYASVTDILGMDHALPITYFRKKFLEGKRGTVDGRRSALFLEACGLKNGEKHVLEFFLAIARTGKKGTIATHELNAEMCAEIVSCKCKSTKFRTAVNGLCAKGWLSKSYIPTGRMVPTKLNASGKAEDFKLLKVCKISLTSPSMDLISTKAVCDKYLPCQKVALGASGTTGPKNSLSSLGRCNVNLTIKDTSRPRQEPRLENTSEVKPTSESPVATHVKQPHSGELRQSAQKARKNSGPSFGRKSRNKARKTWAFNRASFLADLFRYSKDCELHRIASLQTDLSYPPMLETALEYDKYIFRWHEFTNARERKRIIERKILPELRAFCAVLIPPVPAHPTDSEIARRRKAKLRKAHDRVRTAFTGFSRSLVSADMPQYILEKILSNSWTLDQVPWMLTSGKFKLSDCKEQELELFRELADIFGQD